MRLSWIAALSSVFISIGMLWAQSPQLQKVADGRYREFENGHFSKDIDHSWTLWRTTSGYELEDHFTDEQQFADRFLIAMSSDNRLPMSPQLQQEGRSLAVVDNLMLEMSSDLRINNLTLQGKQLDGNRAKEVNVLECKNRSEAIRCKGIRGNPKLKTKASRELFYSFSFPMLFGSLVRQSKRNPQQPDKVALAAVSFDSHQQPRVSESDAEVKYSGEDDLHIADQSFRVGKYEMRMGSGSGGSSLTVWATANGLVLGLEAANAPGKRMLLVNYKKYSDY